MEELPREYNSPMSVLFAMDNDSNNFTCFNSTVAREVAFAGHHALHHLAMMKIIANGYALDLPDSFGKAPSTTRFEATK